MRINTSLLALTIALGLFSIQSEKLPTNKVEFNIEIDSRERATRANIRGLFLVNDSIGWASGSGGTFLRMVDGKKWISDTISGYTHLDFRDVHAFDANTALLMSAGEEGRILRTEDGGISWTEVYTRLDSGIFLDGMDFHKWIGYCYGDPINGKFVVTRTDDHGKTWRDVDYDRLPKAIYKEAGFAASGTGMLSTEKMRFVATGGGSTARIMRTSIDQGKWEFFDTPLRSGEGCGIFSLCEGYRSIVAVGGCYLDSTNAEANCAISKDWGKTWQLISVNQPRGYRSCVASSNLKELLVTCGRTGVEYSLEDGVSWIPFSDDGYYTCALADSTGWLMGKRGKMAKLRWNSTQK
jgi:photosystem II stability/assembly factor-like uncharacterized protein